MIVRELHGLYPPVRSKTIEFLAYANAHIHGYIIEPFETLRSHDRQVAVLSSGQSKTSISYHLFGLAVDIWFSLPNGGWPTNSQLSVWPFWKQLGEMGKAFGFEWGGDWKDPDGPGPQLGWDKPHFQMTFGADKNIMADLLERSGMPAVWKYLDSKVKT